MKRLTETSAQGGTAIKPLDPDCGACNFESDKRCFEHLVSMLQRLKAYEDTELMPEEITALRARIAELENYIKEFKLDYYVTEINKADAINNELNELNSKLRERIAELEAELAVTGRALYDASGVVGDSLGSMCPVAFNDVLGDFKPECEDCKGEVDYKLCWQEHFIQQARAELARAELAGEARD